MRGGRAMVNDHAWVAQTVRLSTFVGEVGILGNIQTEGIHKEWGQPTYVYEAAARWGAGRHT